MNQIQEMTIRNCLYLCFPGSSHTAGYARGAMVGLVSGLMGAGKSFSRAMDIVCACVRPDEIVFIKNHLPDSWVPEFEKRITKGKKK